MSDVGLFLYSQYNTLHMTSRRTFLHNTTSQTKHRASREERKYSKRPKRGLLENNLIVDDTLKRFHRYTIGFSVLLVAFRFAALLTVR